MKICVVKQPYVTEFTWESVRFTTPRDLLDKFICRSQNFSLLAGLKADIWVVEDGPIVSDTYKHLKKKHPRGIEVLYNSHKTVPWSNVPWHEYDIVLSADQIIPDDIINQYPDILWCYFEQEHSLPSFARSAQRPDCAYDLFLNHHLSSSRELNKLPQSIAFPYTANPDIIKELLKPVHEAAVFLDSHMIRDRIENLESKVAEYENKCGLPVKHPRLWDFANSYECVGKKLTKKTSEHLADLARCKYFLLVRSGGIGQGAIEAASLGLIVISDSNEIYSRLMCHPACFVQPMNYDEALVKARLIESHPGLQKEIRQFQDTALREHFWSKPIKLLEKGLKIKRDRKPTGIVHPTGQSNSTLTTLKMPSSAVRKRISVVFSGRNDSYGGGFKEKLLAAWKRNSIEFYCRGIETEWIFVEWNPLNKDYLSYTLAPLGFKCYVVSPSVHKEICTNPNMTFMQFFAKNVGIRRATNSWVLATNADCVFGPEVLNFISREQLNPTLIYRAERKDIKPGIFSAPFDEILQETVYIHDSQAGVHFTQAAGDFTLYNKNLICFGYDESITFSDAHIDSRFLVNWSIKNGVKDLSCFRFIGNVFKEDHPLIYRRTSQKKNHHKGKLAWNYEEDLPYDTSPYWGLANREIKQLATNIWHIGELVKPLKHKKGISNILVNPEDSAEVRLIEPHGSKQALLRQAQPQAITIFAIPKQFVGHIGLIQSNAIKSWTLLEPRPEIILCGDDEGVAEFAQKYNLKHIPNVQRNEFGTPLLNDLFLRAQTSATNEICVYINADIILMNDFMPAVEMVAKRFNEFLMIEQRWDTDIPGLIDFEDAHWEQKLRQFVRQNASLHPVTGVDCFVFTKYLWSVIPPFGIGRTMWDIWLVREALLSGQPTIDASKKVTIVHQNHEFSHIPGGKDAAIFKTEVQRNLALGGNDTSLGYTSQATWELTPDGIVLRSVSEFLKERNPSIALKCIESAYHQAAEIVKEQCQHVKVRTNPDYRSKLLAVAKKELVSGLAKNAAKLLLVSFGQENISAARESFREGFRCLRNGDASKAIKYLEKAAKNCMTLPNLHYALAAAYAELGDIFSSKKACEIELSLQPDNDGARRLLERIEKAIAEYNQLQSSSTEVKV